jgi:hypothetical protein
MTLVAKLRVQNVNLNLKLGIIGWFLVKMILPGVNSDIRSSEAVRGASKNFIKRFFFVNNDGAK